jgi:hypothetical protein
VIATIVAADQRRRGERVELRRQLRRRRRIQRGVLAEDRRLQLAQLRARLHADLVEQLAVRLAVGLQRLRLPAAPIQREHQMLHELLARRMLGHQVLQLADDVALAPGRQVGLQPRLQRRQALLLQPRDLGRRERLRREIGKRRPAPQPQRLAQHLGRLRRLAVRQRLPPAANELLEARRVELFGLHVEPVAARCRN